MEGLIEKIKAAEDFAALNPANEDQIESAENKLGIKFAGDYKEYLQSFGVATFDGRELTGIGTSERLDVVHVTNHARKILADFPKDAYVIEEELVDHVVTMQKSDGSIYAYGPDAVETKIAGSLSEYLFGS